MEERIVQLESLSALQDETIQQLNKEIFRQQQDLTRLQRKLDAVVEKIRELAEQGDVAGNERPPHY